ncbi:MFS transporter [Stenotrophomonas sp. S48]|uniref:MFS transporter n=1 Tax=unclassified Stenotrophomonas TaxID=196198 RepID=UPI001900C92B|nr:MULTISPECIES: MFS transporter [unclassified Stenotrophomonas]MBK0026314.1 MFS transporter [Stenotrophomonas sp. S48]MBK0048543.1 MFS transporter [Stenotrophomonas sp. S49]
MTARTAPRWPVRYLLFIGGLGGLLYGIDIGIIAGALPYLEATASQAWHLSSQQLGFVVAAVLLGSVLSSLFAGLVADLIGRRGAMLLAGVLFTASIPIMALASGYTPLLLGRLLQGISGGLIGVVVPLYLAEVLSPERRGRGAAMFQLLLTIGLVLAALIGLYQAHAVDAATEAARRLPDAQQAQALFAAKDHAWRTIFWSCLTPGIVFCVGLFWLSESPRWLVRRGRVDDARRSLQRVLAPDQVEATLAQIQAPDTRSADGKREPLLSRRYVKPFLLACVVLACTQATGINSVLAYAVNILNQAGLSGSVANGADVAIKLLNALMTVAALLLVDRKGRKFLLMLGSGGICVALLAAATLFFQAERGRADVQPQLHAAVQGEGLRLVLDDAQWQQLGAGIDREGRPLQLTVSYAYGDFTNVRALRSDNPGDRELRIERAGTVQPDSVIGTFFRRLHLNPFADPASAAQAPLRIEQARIGPVPAPAHGWAVAACILVFVAFFAVGPGVCVWLALSELMPNRIRSNGMSIALLINQFVSTTIAALFLPTVGHYGYASMFLFWAGCTFVFFLVAALWLPETKGKSLEEIEAHFR